MRWLVITMVFTCCALTALGDEAAPQPDYRELSKLIQQQVVAKLPREVEHRFVWGETIPVPPNLPLPRLRTYVKVGERLEVPHGPWSRIKGRIDEPDKNVLIQVRELHQLEPTKYRLVLDVDANINGEAEWQQWQKGLKLVAGGAVADAALRIALVCDVSVSLDLKSFPPALNIDPKVKELQVDLRRFDLKHIGTRLVTVENPKDLGDRMEELLREALRQSEPMLKEYANEAIARGLREGKGNVAPAALFKAAKGAAATPR